MDGAIALAAVELADFHADPTDRFITPTPFSTVGTRPAAKRRTPSEPAVSATVGSSPAATTLLDLTDFKRDLSELTDRLGQAQDCL